MTEEAQLDLVDRELEANPDAYLGDDPDGGDHASGRGAEVVLSSSPLSQQHAALRASLHAGPREERQRRRLERTVEAALSRAWAYEDGYYADLSLTVWRCVAFGCCQRALMRGWRGWSRRRAARHYCTWRRAQTCLG
jgi:hypothetical protein